MKVSKQALIEWATNLKAESVEVEVDCSGGGSLDRPDGSLGWCCGYNLQISVGEDAPETESAGLDFLTSREVVDETGFEECPDNLLPDGPTCP